MHKNNKGKNFRKEGKDERRGGFAGRGARGNSDQGKRTGKKPFGRDEKPSFGHKRNEQDSGFSGRRDDRFRDNRRDSDSRGERNFSRSREGDGPSRRDDRFRDNRRDSDSRGERNFSRRREGDGPSRRDDRFRDNRRDSDSPGERNFSRRREGDEPNRRDDRSFSKRPPRREYGRNEGSSNNRDRRRPENQDDRKPRLRRTRNYNDQDRELLGDWRNERPLSEERISEGRERGKKRIPEITQKLSVNEGTVRLNKFISNAGICSRREADDFIQGGSVTVNGIVVTELGSKIMPGDEVRFKGRLVMPEKAVYIVMNKPKDCITTSDDPEGRRTILDILGDEVEQRVFAVGRLDRNTTGIILLTNDGDLAQKLTHPSYEVHKVYKATLDHAITKTDFDTLVAGIELEDGPIHPDALAILDDSKMELGIEIHSGRNRIVHRMFNHLGYLVDKLDRVAFAGITKDGLKKGEYRFLTEKEVQQLRKTVGKAKRGKD